MNLESINWEALARLRSTFLTGPVGQADYWQSDTDLESYDQTFAQRIGWKWDYVLGELERRAWERPPGELLDWGCGSGIASRAYLDYFGADGISTVKLWDRSGLARQFAARKIRGKFPSLAVQTNDFADASGDVLLLSHVLTELDDSQLERLLQLAASATAILWVEPGTYAAARKLVELRERLRPTFQIAAPCTHQGACGMLDPENAQHWCHHFAPSPPEVFTDGNWARFAALAGIDLRSLPLSFLVLDKRPLPESGPGAVRIIGRPRIYKAHALLLASGSVGVKEKRLSKRALPDQFRALKKGEADVLQVWDCQGDQIVRMRPYLEKSDKGF